MCDVYIRLTIHVVYSLVFFPSTNVLGLISKVAKASKVQTSGVRLNVLTDGPIMMICQSVDLIGR